MYSRKTTSLLMTAAFAAVFAMGASGAERKVHYEVMDNGMGIAVAESHSSPVVSLQVWIRAGSTTEGELSGSGVSHFVEHMIFKGTKKRSLGAFDREVRGAGGTLNAYTSRDRTVLHCTVASRHWRGIIEALADVVQNSTFEPAEVEKEQKVIVRELTEHLDNPRRVHGQLSSSNMYRVHPYRLPVGGHIEQFKRLTREDLYGYYRKFFVPNNMFFVVAGDVKTADVVAASKPRFGALLSSASTCATVPSVNTSAATTTEPSRRASNAAGGYSGAVRDSGIR